MGSHRARPRLSPLHCRHLADPATSFADYGKITARLKDASKFLENIAGDRGWDSARALLEDRAILRKYASQYDDLSRNAQDCLEDMTRSKEHLVRALTSGIGETEEAAEEQDSQESLEQS